MAKKKSGNVLTRIIAGVNIGSVIAMLIVGYSYYANPEAFPKFATVGLFFPFFVIINIAFLVFWFFVKKKYLLISVAGFIACAVPIRTYCPLNFPTSVPEDAIKVLTYNTLWYGQNKYDEDGKNEVIEYIKDVDADIVCLQEANSPTIRLWDMKKALDKYKYFSVDVTGDKGLTDILTISKYPIVKFYKLPMESTRNGVTAFWLDMGKDTVIVVNCHLESYQFTHDEKEEYKNVLRDLRDYNIEGSELKSESKKIINKISEATVPRSGQARTLAEFIRENKDESIIVCGDFNDNPISYTHHTIASELTDCFVASGNGIGISYNEKGFAVRIDNILCSKDWTPYDCKVDSKITASDHYPMICHLKKD